MDKQLKLLLKKNICNLIKYTTEEKFAIEEDLQRIKQNYIHDEDFIQFDVLMHWIRCICAATLNLAIMKVQDVAPMRGTFVVLGFHCVSYPWGGIRGVVKCWITQRPSLSAERHKRARPVGTQIHDRTR